MSKKPRHLIKSIYTADPRAHVYEGKLYIFPSHDIESGIPQDDLGSHFDMKDYHVYSMEDPDGEVVDHGVALDIKDVPWAVKQMWSNDVACKDGKYYMYFPAKDENSIFHIGVAVADKCGGLATHPRDHPHCRADQGRDQEQPGLFLFFIMTFFDTLLPAHDTSL